MLEQSTAASAPVDAVNAFVEPVTIVRELLQLMFFLWMLLFCLPHNIAGQKSDTANRKGSRRTTGNWPLLPPNRNQKASSHPTLPAKISLMVQEECPNDCAFNGGISCINPTHSQLLFQPLPVIPSPFFRRLLVFKHPVKHFFFVDATSSDRIAKVGRWVHFHHDGQGD